jgi:hypothetical protein
MNAAPVTVQISGISPKTKKPNMLTHTSWLYENGASTGNASGVRDSASMISRLEASGATKPGPSCPRPTPPPCCSGRSWHPVRSTCAKSLHLRKPVLMAGRRLHQSQSIGQLTSPHDAVPSITGERATPSLTQRGTTDSRLTFLATFISFNQQSRKVLELMTIVQTSRVFLVGFATAIAVSLTITVIGHFSLSEARLNHVITIGLFQSQFEQRGLVLIKDHWSECGFLMMEKVQPQSVLRNAIDTYLAHDFRYHFCDILKTEYLGGPLTDVKLAHWDYQNYPFGARHVLAVVMSFMELVDVHGLYMILSSVTVALMFFGALCNSPANAKTVAPVGIYLCFAFATHLLGDNLAYAPSLIFAFTALSIFLFAKKWFSEWCHRVFFFAMMATMVLFFEPSTGTVPITIALTVVFNQLFYSDREAPPDMYWSTSAKQALTILACFFFAIIIHTSLRIGAIWLLYGADVEALFGKLAARMSDQVDGSVQATTLATLQRIWDSIGNLSPGGRPVALIFLGASMIAWIVMLFMLPIAIRSMPTWRRSVLAVDVILIAVSAAGIFLWYRLFRNHIYIHAFFMVRLLVIPASFGFVALLRVGQQVDWASLRAGARKTFSHRLSMERAR